MHIFDTSWPICVKSDVGDFHIMPLNSYELCENWYSENHTLSPYL